MLFSSVRPLCSVTTPRTRTSSASCTVTPRPLSKTNRPSEVAGSASGPSSSTKKPDRPVVVSWSRRPRRPRRLPCCLQADWPRRCPGWCEWALPGRRTGRMHRRRCWPRRVMAPPCRRPRYCGCHPTHSGTGRSTGRPDSSAGLVDLRLAGIEQDQQPRIVGIAGVVDQHVQEICRGHRRAWREVGGVARVKRGRVRAVLQQTVGECEPGRQTGVAEHEIAGRVGRQAVKVESGIGTVIVAVEEHHGQAIERCVAGAAVEKLDKLGRVRTGRVRVSSLIKSSGCVQVAAWLPRPAKVSTG